MSGEQQAPLSGLSVLANASGVAATYAARMLGTMGAQVLLVEATAGSPLRLEPPFLGREDGSESGVSALFAYLTAGMDTEAIDLTAKAGRERLLDRLANADIFIDDTPLGEREKLGIDEPSVAERFPALVHVSVLPFGASGPKAGWKGEDVVVQHAGGEGNLLPNGLAVEMFPDRAPLKIAGHFGEMQGGVAAALGALAAIWARDETGGQYVDISSQDANLAVGAFAIQRLGDGSIEHRAERSFRYGGVVPCTDGYLELLTLEQRQWDGLIELLGRPQWALDPALADSLERSRRGPEINAHIRAWAASRNVDDIVAAGQDLGVPLARYMTAGEILVDPQARHRRLFEPVAIGDVGTLPVLVSPFHFDAAPLALGRGPPALDHGPRVAPAATDAQT